MANSLNDRRPNAAAPSEVASGDSRWHRRGVLIVAMILTLLSGIALYAGPARMVVCYRLLTDGGMLAIWIGSAIGLGHFVLRITRLWERESPAALKWTTAAAMGLGVISLVVLGLGLAGILNVISAWAILIAGLGCGAFGFLHDCARPGASYLVGSALRTAVSRSDESVRDADPTPNRTIAGLTDWLKESAGWEWLWLLASPFLSMAVIAAVVPPGMLWNPEEPHGYDVVEYHLQIPREWYEAGRIVPLHHNVFGYLPFNVEMHYLLAMHLRGGPWAGMYFAQLMHVAFMSLAVLAVYGLARAMAPPKQAVISAFALLSVPWLTQLAAIAYDEGGLLLFGILAIGLSLQANLDHERRIRRLALAGVMAGFAAGSKLTGVPEVLVAVPVVTAVMLLWRMIGRRREALGPVPSPLYSWERDGVRGHSGEQRISPAGPSPQPSPPSTGEREPDAHAAKDFVFGIIIFSLLGLATFSPWLMRNLAWARNPIFPEMMPLLGKSDFTPHQVERWDMSLKPPPAEQSFPARIRRFWREIVLGWQFGYLLLPLTAVAFALTARQFGSWYLLGHLALLTCFWLLFTHLQGRFFLLAAPIAALLLAQVDWRRATPGVAVIVVLFAAIAWWGIHSRLMIRLNEINNDRVRALGAEDLSDLLLTEIAPDGLPPGVKLVLIGDARAFWYPLPMSRLRYRTVFDVKGGSPDFLTAWAGSEVNAPGTWIVIDPAEIRRFLRTYQNLPPVPEDVLHQEGISVRKR